MLNIVYQNKYSDPVYYNAIMAVTLLNNFNNYLKSVIGEKNIDIQSYKEFAGELQRVSYQIRNDYQYLLKKHFELGKELEAYKKIFKSLRQMCEPKNEERS